MIKVWNKILNIVLDIIYPRRCPVCDEIVSPHGCLVCRECSHKLTVVKEPLCKQCGKPVNSKTTEYCYDCGRKKWQYDQGCAVFLYNEEMKQSIYRFKYSGRKEYKNYYVKIMAERCGHKIREWRPDVIIPVPLHPKRQQTRGFNQAWLLAVGLSKYLDIPVDNQVVIRKKETTPQKMLGNVGRKQNIAGTFAVSGKAGRYHSVLVVDDIYTTGNTVNEMARVLKRAGVHKVYVLTLSIAEGAKV